MRAILVCAGVDQLQALYHYQTNDLLIAVDGGIDAINNLSLTPNYYFGDKDSINKQTINAKTINTYSPIKDDSDFDLAISFVIEKMKKGIITETIVYNATGGRLDHYYAILNTIIKYKDYNIKIIDDKNEIFMSKKEMTFSHNDYQYISFFSLTCDTILSLENFKYNVSNYHLKRFENLCLSNEVLINKKAHLITNNEVLVIRSNSI